MGLNTTAQAAAVRQSNHGLYKGKELHSFILTNDVVEIEVTNLGCIISAIHTPDRNGVAGNIVAGFKSLDEYKINPYYFGCVIGRYANRIANGRFCIDDKVYRLAVNNDVNHLHGGNFGFDKKVWNIQDIIETKTEAGVVFSYLSEDGEEGFPGNLNVTVTYTLNEKNELVIRYAATTDKATPVSLTNHSYFNLTGFENDSILDHFLTINSDEYTEKNGYNQPTGHIVNLAGSVFDFRTSKKIGTDILNDVLANDRGYDHNFVLKHRNSDKLVHGAALSDEETGRIVDVFTTAPGIQVYTANFFEGTICGAQDKYYQPRSAVALETQSFPDSPNHPNFPNTILHPGEEYHSTTIYAFGISH